LGNPTTLPRIVYCSCTTATSMLFCIICVRFEVAARECCKFNCKHFMLVFHLDLLVVLCKL
jgi:hypothetical protein